MKELLRKFFCSICKSLSEEGYTPTTDVPSPSDILPRSAIKQSLNMIEIALDQILIPFTKPPRQWKPSVANSKSMDPVFDIEHTPLLIAGADKENRAILADNLEIGDVIVFAVGKQKIIHRIVEINVDEEGRFFRTKGDNNYLVDPYIIRDKHIEWLMIGIIF